MTKKIITRTTALLYITVVMLGITTVHASEVTGTLSSNASLATDPSGNIGGTVISESSRGGSSSGGSSSGGGSLSNAPSGAVFGASTDSTLTPGFPNAGTAPAADQTRGSLWLMSVDFFKSLLSL